MRKRTAIARFCSLFNTGAIFLSLIACGSRIPTSLPETSNPPILPTLVDKLSTTRATPSPQPPPYASSSTPVIVPTPGDCSPGFVAYSAELQTAGRENEGGVYLACADGSFRQRIVAFTAAAPEITAQSSNRLAAFRDGSQLLFSYHDVRNEKLYTTSISLADYDSTVLFKQDYVLSNAQPSPDNQYVGYLIYPSNHQLINYLEVMHLPSQTVSRVVGIDSIWDFDWSSDGKRILLHTLGPSGMAETWHTYAIGITCDPRLHTCAGHDQTRLDNVLSFPYGILMHRLS